MARDLLVIRACTRVLRSAEEVAEQQKTSHRETEQNIDLAVDSDYTHENKENNTPCCFTPNSGQYIEQF